MNLYYGTVFSCAFLGLNLGAKETCKNCRYLCVLGPLFDYNNIDAY